DFFKYIGPGFLVAIGFIDPGNWASNVSAGSDFGYKLLWVITVSTIMLIILQHNAAHLGIVTGYCLSEASTIYLKPWISKITLITAVLASISTAFAEILGGAIALNMLFKLPIKIGSLLVLAFVSWMLFTSSYKKIEKWIICFVSLIGLSFIIELSMVHIEWHEALTGWTLPSFPRGAMPIIMSALGAVVMPHNLYLHSEIIQSRQWNLKDERIIAKQLDYEFMDTLLSMLIGWAINSAIIIIAAATFFAHKIPVTELGQAHEMLIPLLGNKASAIFAVSLLFSGVSSCITAGMAGGSIFTGFFKEPYDIHDMHTKVGVAITLIAAFIVVLLIQDPFKGLVYSQTLLSIQLP
ncbi:MAG TPA: Mg2+/Co2+ transporter, partial [Clostridiaceae bacterium]|nr:Mg2+/Co2+ transporter [Clostridiaceae bacterium]